MSTVWIFFYWCIVFAPHRIGYCVCGGKTLAKSSNCTAKLFLICAMGHSQLQKCFTVSHRRFCGRIQFFRSFSSFLGASLIILPLLIGCQEFIDRTFPDVAVSVPMYLYTVYQVRYCTDPKIYVNELLFIFGPKLSSKFRTQNNFNFWKISGKKMGSFYSKTIYVDCRQTIKNSSDFETRFVLNHTPKCPNLTLKSILKCDTGLNNYRQISARILDQIHIL